MANGNDIVAGKGRSRGEFVDSDGEFHDGRLINLYNAILNHRFLAMCMSLFHIKMKILTKDIVITI